MKTKLNKALLNISWILGTAFLILLTLLHVIKPELNPIWRLISEYEIGSFGWIMRLAFFCWGGGFLFLALSLWNTLKTFSGQIGKWWLIFISVSVIGAGIFATQPITDITRGNIDRLHAFCGAIMIFTFPIVALLIAIGLSKQFSSSDLRVKLILVTVLVWIGFLAFFSSMIIYGEQVKIRAYDETVLIGLPNRFMVLAYTLWLITMARLLNSMNKSTINS